MSKINKLGLSINEADHQQSEQEGIEEARFSVAQRERERDSVQMSLIANLHLSKQHQALPSLLLFFTCIAHLREIEPLEVDLT